MFVTRGFSKFLPTGGKFGQSEMVAEGTQVEMIRRGWGFSLVKLRDGRSGEIASEALRKDERGWVEEKVDKVFEDISYQDSPRFEEVQSGEEAFHGESVEPDLPEW